MDLYVSLSVIIGDRNARSLPSAFDRISGYLKFLSRPAASRSKVENGHGFKSLLGLAAFLALMINQEEDEND